MPQSPSPTRGADGVRHRRQPPRFGVGLGCIIGYSCEGDYRGRTFASRGYMASIDRESVDRTRPGFPTGASV